MTVSTTTDRITYLGDGATTTFTFSFPAVATNFIQVIITDPTGVFFTATPDTYSIVLNPPIDPNPTSIGGTVTYPLVGPPLAIGNSITILRSLPITQTASISNQSIVYPPVIEQEFDYLTMLDQDNQNVFSRAFQVGPSDPIPALVPPVAMRANQAAIFDALGNLTAGAVIVGSISPAMVPVVTATTLPLARTAMGVPPVDSPTFTGTPAAPTPAPGDNDTSIATTAFVQAALVGIGAIFTTGDLKPTHKTTADTGWILWNDGTIGDATSGSTNRANADTSALFTLYYNSYSDARCPLKTSTGTATNRAAQGTAAAAFAAHCRMTLPKGESRSVGLAGHGSSLTARGLGATVGSETHVQDISEMAAHTHIGAAAGSPFVLVEPPSTAPFDSYTTGPTTLWADSLSTEGSSAPMDIMNPTTYINIMIKL